MKRFGAVLTAVLAIIIATMVATPTPSYAHAHTPAVTNIQVAQGHNPGEVIVSWDAVPQVTHYRIGYVNMETDYPLAKASVTGEWLEAFVYVDVDARNFTVSGGRVEYTLRRLAQGVRHAFSVRTGNDIDGAFTWPSNPRWRFHVVADQGGACPSVAPTTVAPTSCVTDGTCLPITSVGTYSGSGDNSDIVIHLRAGLYRAKMMHTGSSNFIVHLIEVDTGRTEYLANEIGNADDTDTFTIYDDDRSFRPQPGNYLLTVEADGDWTTDFDLVAAH